MSDRTDMETYRGQGTPENPDMSPCRDLSVIGLGLIGGSLVRSADAAGWKVRGATRSEATATAARETWTGGS